MFVAVPVFRQFVITRRAAKGSAFLDLSQSYLRAATTRSIARTPVTKFTQLAVNRASMCIAFDALRHFA
jgi:hypothetical protein